MKPKEQRESPRGRSMLSNFVSCRRKWAFERVKGYRPKGNFEALTLGSIVHEAQEVIYKGGTKEEMLARSRKLAEKLEPSFQEKITAKLWPMLDEWYKVLGEPDMQNLEVLAVEKEAEIKLLNGFKMTVRYDRVLRDPESGQVFISDTKTTGWSLENTILKYNYHDQPRLYILAAQSEPWYKDLIGWRTDVLYKNRSVCRVKRSEVVMPTEQQLRETLLTYTGITDDIKFSLDSIASGEGIAETFYCNTENCFAYSRECAHFGHCSQINDLTEPPEGFTLDPWLGEGLINKAFKEIN